MISEQTFQETNEFSTSGTKVEPDAAKRVTGMAENEGLPFEYFNYYINLLTKNNKLFRASLESVLAEATSFLSGYNVTPDQGQTDQIIKIFKSKFIDYDFIVYDQESFNLLFEQVSANNYKIKDNIKNVYFKNISEGYDISGIFTEGDTWANLLTNNCTHLIFQNGGFINVGDTASYMQVNTDDATLENVWLKGTGASAVSVSQSFLLNANRVVFKNCKTSNRLFSGSSFYAFRGSSTALHNITSKYKNCSVFDMDADTISTDFGAFTLCQNLENPLVYNIDADSATGAIRLFYYCDNIFNLQMYNVDITDIPQLICFYYCKNISNALLDSIVGNIQVRVFDECNIITNCYASQIESGTSSLRGMNNCSMISNCELYDLTTTSNCVGFYYCTELSGCKANTLESSNITYAFEGCESLVRCKAENITSTGQSARGFFTCSRLSGCYAYNITGASSTYGFRSCSIATSCMANTITSDAGNTYGWYQGNMASSCFAQNVTSNTGNAYGFYSVLMISCCMPESISSTSGTAEGFVLCSYGSSLYTTEPVNSSNNWMDTVDTNVTNKVSTPSVFT